MGVDMADDQPKREKSAEEQLQEMLRTASLQFAMPGNSSPAQSEAAEPKSDDSEEDALRHIREFSLKPKEIRNHLNRFVIQQDEAKKVLSVAICDHYNHVRACIESPEIREREYAKHNIVLLGPSGVGKTYLMRCIAKLIGVPFVKADATKFSETGYVGHDVDDLVRDLVKAANGNIDLAQYGIIYLDEIDKIASSSEGGGKDVSGRGVQTTLLKIMEDTDVSLFSQTDIIGQMQAVMIFQRSGSDPRRTINTGHILFIVSGAFDKLTDVIKKRVRTSQIGFVQDDEASVYSDTDYLHEVQTRDFIEHGFEPEFIGRIPVRVVCDPLSTDDLVNIMLHSEGSILRQYCVDFAGYGIDLEVAHEAVVEIASRANREKTGARGLMTVLERVLRNFKFEMPSCDLRNLTVTASTVIDPQSAIEAMLKRNGAERQKTPTAKDLDGFARSFKDESGIQLTFTREAVVLVEETCAKEKISAQVYCMGRFKDLEYGLKLISRNTGRISFRLTKRFMQNPGKELSSWVAKSFSPAEV